ncbi:DUF1501 domain-containing protein [Roseiconus lacunae]|uniref:DUF1501 domain-containing protein n=1 Tax=Roseiconus lacunae TaxID=2605694 RepID=A0ABT7PGQ1_9BACT|nr:DUF1501 domain-containing protein [Roseiconus lacunae]MCD0460560.1 DUF1501 domain-containing protein [Roseiconus lacunae]MDM4015391.1 DUF1501 domain-containing protein [Roseiconus lacunae]WRQ52931.1 DUF1501 domain-containing protein [Stieleria sp. HD01]
MFGSRRQFLETASTGFGAAALSAIMASQRATADHQGGETLPEDAALKRTHFPAKAKHVIFCYMSGGVSHLDSFDPKPELQRLHGKSMPVAIERTQFNNNGNVMASPFKFRQHGESGMPVSELFPHLAGVVDELAVIRSMTTAVNEHAQGNFVMHSGFPFMGHPSAGAWCSYGLGCETDDLPGFVVLQSGGAVAPHGGVSLFSSGYLPAEHQGSILVADAQEAIRNLRPRGVRRLQQRRLEFASAIDSRFVSQTQHDSQVEAAIKNYETAFRMQASVPELCDLSQESLQTRQSYGLESKDSQMAAYGRQCLLARRLVEKGVRFIELSCLPQTPTGNQAPNPWDQHSGLEKGHRVMSRQVDQPIAALIKDLKDRGLLDETLIVWAGEFGRTPFSQGSDGRDHNPFGFSVWMAGGGVKGGVAYGATDELGYYTVENKLTVYDLWATVLHLLGVDHTKLTYRYSGRDFRLTDVHGEVISPVLV